MCRTFRRLVRRTALFAALSLFLVIASPAQLPYRFLPWTTEDGLPQNSIQALLQTRDGYAASRPDLVIMDIGMKDLDGIAACRQIRAMDPAARIVLVSDYDDAAMRESARHAGACGYVLKDNLLEVRGLLSRFPAPD